MRRRPSLNACLMAGMVFAQPAEKLEFEVASVRPAAPSAAGEIFGLRGGPGSSDPERISFRRESLETLLLRAFSLQPDRLSGPNWLLTAYYDITAKVRAGATREQFNQMLQSLLAERFSLTYHYAKKDITVYSLVVAKGGPKMKEMPADPSIPAVREERPPRLVIGNDGFPELPPGNAPAAMSTTSSNGVTSRHGRQAIGGLAREIQTRLGGGVRVVDKTGLTGIYDYRLRFARETGTAAPGVDGPEPDLFAALEEQLGLKLEKGSGSVDVLVVDRAERVPAGN